MLEVGIFPDFGLDRFSFLYVWILAEFPHLIVWILAIFSHLNVWILAFLAFKYLIINKKAVTLQAQ